MKLTLWSRLPFPREPDIDLDGDLVGAHLANTNLVGIDLSGRDLTGACLAGADLSDCKLLGTCLRDAIGRCRAH